MNASLPSQSSRRSFLQSAATAAAALALRPGAGRAQPAPAPATPRRMTIALTPGSIGVSVGSQRELIALAHQYKFESVEPRGEELARMSQPQVEDTLADLNARGLVWAAAGLPVDFRRDDATHAEGMKRLPDIAAGLRRAGVTRMGTWLSPSHESLTYHRNFQQHTVRLREVASLLGDHGVRFGVEYVGTRHLLVGRKYPFLHTLAETRELIAAINVSTMGVVLDTCHWWTAGDSEEELLALRNEEVVSVDLNDAPLNLAREDQRDNARELPVATGVIDTAQFLRALHRIGYDGPVRPEPFNRALNDLDNAAALEAASAALHKAMALLPART